MKRRSIAILYKPMFFYIYIHQFVIRFVGPSYVIWILQLYSFFPCETSTHMCIPNNFSLTCESLPIYGPQSSLLVPPYLWVFCFFHVPTMGSCTLYISTTCHPHTLIYRNLICPCEPCIASFFFDLTTLAKSHAPSMKG